MPTQGQEKCREPERTATLGARGEQPTAYCKDDRNVMVSV